MSDLLRFTANGIYCRQAGVYIDPWKPVAKALITHGHSDHARPGMKRYLCTTLTRPILQHRLGRGIRVDTVEFNEEVNINGVKFSFHPAGHVIGSAQIRAEYKGEVWVVSGDYKTQDDGISGAFELVPCHVFITESTFGLPVYRWPAQDKVVTQINRWWASNRADGKASVLSAYSLGKAQRIIQNIDVSIGPVFCHGAVQLTNEAIIAAGVRLRETRLLDDSVGWDELKGALVIAPGSSLSGPWMKRFRDCSTAAASGWMAVRGTRRWQSLDRGFVMSDHADWNGLNDTVEATGAERVIVTHGYTDTFARWLNDKGIQGQTEKTMFEGETEG